VGSLRADDNPYLDQAKANVKLTEESARAYAGALLGNDVFQLIAEIVRQLNIKTDYDLDSSRQKLEANILAFFGQT
jgi:hypothetical protein